MKLSSTTVLFLLAPVFGFGCRGCLGNDLGNQTADQFTVGEFEGDQVGECSDQADNDRDGYFDCKDNGCWGHPDCEGQTGNGTGAPTGNTATGNTGTGTTQTTTGDCVADICDITSVDVEYAIVIDVDPQFAGFGGVCSCQMIFEGQADVHEIREADLQITMGNGWWEQTNAPVSTIDPCPGGLDQCVCGPPEDACTWGFEDGIWWDAVNFDAYQSFAFDVSGTQINNWIVHDVSTTYLPTGSPIANRQFYITEMGAAYDATETSPEASMVLVESPPDLAILGVEVTHIWTATFQK